MIGAMAEIKSSKSLAPLPRLPFLRSFFSVLVAALGSSSVGYALGYPSSALLDLAELPGDRAFKSIETLLFGVSCKSVLMWCTCVLDLCIIRDSVRYSSFFLAYIFY